MKESKGELERLQSDLIALKDKVELSKYVAAAATTEAPSNPATTLMHVRLQENVPNVDALSRYLWTRATNYAISRKRRKEFRDQIAAEPDGDVGIATLIVEAARDAFLEFRKEHPNRASEVGEVLAYCIAIEQLGAAQLAAKMSLKTNNNMPVHGLDGIHAKVEKGHLYVYFLESKISKTAAAGVADFAESVAEFSSNRKQYRREYSIVKDLGNLDTLDPESKKLALRYFDVLASPDEVPKRERFVGVVLYSDKKSFESLPAVSEEQPAGFHEEILANAYTKVLGKHQQTAMSQLNKQAAAPDKCIVYYVAVPDTGELRKMFYEAMGYTPKGGQK